MTHHIVSHHLQGSRSTRDGMDALPRAGLPEAEGEGTLRMRRLPLYRKTAIVTDGFGGLGVHVVKLLARLGARVAVVSSSGEDPHGLRQEVAWNGWQVVYIDQDELESDGVAQLFDHATDLLGAIDYFVNIISIEGRKLMPDVGEGRSYVPKDLIGGLRRMRWVAREVALQLIEKKRSGSLINIVSVCTKEADDGGDTYVHAANSLALMNRSMAEKHSTSSLRVNAVAVDLTCGRGGERCLDAQFQNTWTRARGTQRGFDLHELDDALLLLMSDASSSVNGAFIPMGRVPVPDENVSGPIETPSRHALGGQRV